MESRKEEVAEDHNESGKVMIEEQGTERNLLHLDLAIGNVHNVVNRILQSVTNALDVVDQREWEVHEQRATTGNQKILNHCILPDMAEGKGGMIDGCRDSLPRCN